MKSSRKSHGDFPSRFYKTKKIKNKNNKISKRGRNPRPFVLNANAGNCEFEECFG